MDISITCHWLEKLKPLNVSHWTKTLWLFLIRGLQLISLCHFRKLQVSTLSMHTPPAGTAQGPQLEPAGPDHLFSLLLCVCNKFQGAGALSLAAVIRGPVMLSLMKAVKGLPRAAFTHIRLQPGTRWHLLLPSLASRFQHTTSPPQPLRLRSIKTESCHLIKIKIK